MKKIIFVLILLFTTFVHSQDLLKYNQIRNINKQVMTLREDFINIQESFDKQVDKTDILQLNKIFEIICIRTDQLEIIYFSSEMVSHENKMYRDKYLPPFFVKIYGNLDFYIKELNQIIGNSNNYTIKKYSEELKTEIRKIKSIIK